MVTGIRESMYPDRSLVPAPLAAHPTGTALAVNPRLRWDKELIGCRPTVHSQSCSVGVATVPLAGRSGVRIRLAATSRRDSYSVGTGVILQRWNGRGVKLTNHVHLVPRLRMSGAVPLLLLHVILLCVHYVKLPVIFLRVKRPGRETMHPVPKLRMSGVIRPHMASWRGKVNLHVFPRYVISYLK
jgi:hypothetical protein